MFFTLERGHSTIDRQFENGIEDSACTFNDPTGNTSTKKIFDKGETMSIGGCLSETDLFKKCNYRKGNRHI